MGHTFRVRVLFSSTRGAGHFNPLVPFARAFERAGHELLFAGPPPLAGSVEKAGFDFWQFDSPTDDELGPVWGRVPELPQDEQNEVVVRDIFGRLNTSAALPRIRAVFEEWGPELVLHDPNEYSSALTAEENGITHARVAVGLSSVEELGLDIVDQILDADVLRRSPYLSVFPPSLDEGAQPSTYRFHDPAWDTEPGELPAWWPGREDRPLVYVTFGSVAGQFPQALPVYGVALRAVAELPVRVLLTVGHDLDLDALPSTPDNVRIERWVPQQDVLGHAAMAVVHGGSGSTLGAIAAGVPLVVVPLFADQPQNARRVVEVGAGLSVEPDREAPDSTTGPLHDAVEIVLAESSYGERARGLAEELRAQPPADDAVPLLESLARS
jgi:UDP:flavonoid glycosyltransferase YjiC (YdhE family)